MRNRNNLLRNIPPHAFSIIQASHADFQKELRDIPERYPLGRFTYINNHRFLPLFQFREKEKERLDHWVITSFADLLHAIDADISTILFIEYELSWFRPDNPEDLQKFCQICRMRAKRRGPIVIMAVVPDRGLSVLKGTVDYFFSLGEIKEARLRVQMSGQKILDEMVLALPGLLEKKRLYGQMKLCSF